MRALFDGTNTRLLPFEASPPPLPSLTLLTLTLGPPLPAVDVPVAITTVVPVLPAAEL